MQKTTMNYNSYKIELDEQRRFHVPGLDDTYDSYRQATDAIDRAIKATKTVKVKLAIDVVTADGKMAVITGVHSGHGALLVSPKIGRFDSDKLYIRVQWIEAAIKEIQQLRDRISDLREAVDTFEVSGPGYGFNQDKYATHVSELEDRAKALLAKAVATDLAKELEKAERKPKQKFRF